jgi:hypothetical protein
LNPWPLACHASALPAELQPRKVVTIARGPGGSQRSADVEVDPEEDQGPEEDGQEGGDDELDQADVDVAFGPGDVEADQDVDEAEETEPATDHGARPLPPCLTMAR